MMDQCLSKKCFKCGEEKPLDMFYKHPAMLDGHVNKCKECNKKDVSSNYRANREYYYLYDLMGARPVPERPAAPGA